MSDRDLGDISKGALKLEDAVEMEKRYKNTSIFTQYVLYYKRHREKAGGQLSIWQLRTFGTGLGDHV